MLIDPSDDPELESLMELVAEAALRSPSIYAELMETAELARRRLAELEALGLVRAVWAADGSVAIELLRRVLQ
jgi:hypothetical protein